MSARTSLSALIAFAVCAVATAQVAPEPAPNTLTRAERAAGWKLLFDGKSTTAWQAYKGKGFPEKGWSVADGCIKTHAGEGAPDIVTVDEYGDFELAIEWKVAPKANSGIMFRVTDQHATTWQSGPEYQILDDAGHNMTADNPHSAGALYDLYPPVGKKSSRPAGEFNQTRIRLKDGVLQHFLNGAKVLECRIDTPEWAERIAASKFKTYSGFGAAAKGRIALQHHGGDVWFRNIKIRDLSAKMPGEIALFNGRDLSGWKAILPEGGKKLEDVWSVQDGVIVCKGQPIGYIRTENDYKNFVLKLEWRFNPVTKKAGNSGVLLRMIGEDKVWPRSVEAQLQSENAGDFWNIDEFPMKTVAERLSGRNTKKTHMAERPIGEWNEYEIVVDGGNIVLNVNGEELNRAWDVQEVAGKICLQSEGAEIHFRNIRLAPID